MKATATKQNVKSSLLDIGRVRSGFRLFNEVRDLLEELDTQLRVFHYWFVNASRNNEVDDTVSIDISFDRIEEMLGKI